MTTENRVSGAHRSPASSKAGGQIAFGWHEGDGRRELAEELAEDLAPASGGTTPKCCDGHAEEPSATVVRASPALTYGLDGALTRATDKRSVAGRSSVRNVTVMAVRGQLPADTTSIGEASVRTRMRTRRG